MSYEFELRRIQDKIKELRKEREKTTQLIVKVRRDEQMDIDRVRRNYDIKVKAIEQSQLDMSKELARKERDLKALMSKIEEAGEDADGARDYSGRQRFR